VKPTEFIVWPLGTLYRAGFHARTFAYRTGWFHSHRLPGPVISIGNITTGGTGKTPLVEWVCRRIAEIENKRVCVLTRGYGRKNPTEQVLVSDGNEVIAKPDVAGDEPYLLARNLLGKAAVVANVNRRAAGEWAYKNLGSEVFVLDDGFQHFEIQRDLDIVTIDATNPFGNSMLLPAGPLREPTKNLRRANCIVLTRTEQVKNVKEIVQQISTVAKNIPVFTSRMVTQKFTDVAGDDFPLAEIKDKAIGAFCAVGNSSSFFEHLRSESLQPLFSRSYRDHHQYTQLDVDGLTAHARRTSAEALITTAKDATKLANLKLEIPCYVLHIEIEFDETAEVTALISSALQKK